MKETGGEFSMTVVVIIGAIIIVGILTAIGPRMGQYINDQWNNFTNSGTGAANQSGQNASGNP